MNIIQTRVINMFGNPSGTKYIFRVPEGVEIAKDTLLLAQRNGGKEGTQIVKSVTNSAEVSDEVLEMITDGRKVISSIIGELRLVPCEDLRRLRVAECENCLWFRDNLGVTFEVCDGREHICDRFIAIRMQGENGNEES